MSFEHWQDEVQKRLGELQTHVNELRVMETSSKGSTELQRRKQIDACNRRLDEAREARKNCDRAVRIVKDPTKRLQGKDMLRQVDKQMRDFQDDIRRAELNLNHASAHTAVDLGGRATDEEFKKEIDRVQAGMKDSYARQLKTLDRTLDVAHATRESVEVQGEQVHNIATETERIGDNLQRADFHVKRFKKQVSTDRVFQVLLASNVAVFITLLTLVILNRRVILDAVGL